MAASGFSTLCFGKLPSHPDFVRFNAAGREALACDEWLRQGLYGARTQMGQGWEQAVSSAPPYSFIFSPENSDRFLAGVMQPSQDKSQRRYPFVVSLVMDRRCFQDQELHLAPAALARFLEEARQMVRRAMGGLETREIAEGVQALADPLAGRSAAEAEYRTGYLDATPVKAFWQELFGTGEDPRRYLVVRNLEEVLEPLRRRNGVHTNLGLRFPLPAVSTGLELRVSFWLQASFQVLRAWPGRPSLFWNLPEAGRPAYLFVFFRQPSPRHFVQLLKPDAESETICAVEEDGKTKLDQVMQAVPAHHRASLQAGDQPLGKFLSSL